MINANLISDFLLALVIFLTTFAGQRASMARSRKKENRRLNRVNEVQYNHIFRLRRILISHGLVPPALPKELIEDEEEEDNQ